MPTIETIYTGNLRTQMVHLQSGNMVITDAPTDNKGQGEAFSPTDLLAASLGSCMLTIMGISAMEHGFSLEGTRIEITKIMGTQPRRVQEIVIDFFFPPNNYSESQKRLINHAVKTCPVSQSLHPDLVQTIHLNF